MEFFGLIGEKLSHSISPEIHNNLFKELNIEGAYKLCPIEKSEINNLTTCIKTIGIKGVNVTIPYKEEIIKYLDFISDEAKEIGAVNTIYLKDNKLYGYNTDYYGFGKMLDVNNISYVGKDIVILGAGGAAKAIYQFFKDNKPNNIYVVSREKNKSFLDAKVIDYNDLEKVKGDILVNTTPVGMYPNVNKCPVSEEVINKFSDIVDIIYNPEETLLLKLGNKLNKKTCNGLYMLVGQAIKAEEIWNNIKVEDSISNKIYEMLKGLK